MVRAAAFIRACVIVASLGCTNTRNQAQTPAAENDYGRPGSPTADGGESARPSTEATPSPDTSAAQGGGPAAAAPSPGSSGTATAGAMSAPQSGFIHPGLLITADDIARMKAKIADQSEAHYSSFTALRNDPESQANKTVQAAPTIIGRNDASAYASTRYTAENAAVTAFQNALVYVLTGEVQYADKAVEILDSYAKTTKHFDKADPERDLEAAILGWLWVSTAELIRTSSYPGWSENARSQFNAWIYNVVYADTDYEPNGVLVTPLVNGAGARGAFGLRTKIAIGVYLDDRKIYDETSAMTSATARCSRIRRIYDTISATGRGQFATIYELPYTYFHTQLNLDLPCAKQAIEREGVELFSAQNDNPMFATLTYRR
jgi:hypothetical protein